MAGKVQTAGCWCPGCGVFHAGATLRCRWKDEPNYPDPLQGYAGKTPAYDAEVLARMEAKYGGKQAAQEGQDMSDGAQAPHGVTVEKVRQALAVFAQGDAWAEHHGYLDHPTVLWCEDGQEHCVYEGVLVEAIEEQKHDLAT